MHMQFIKVIVEYFWEINQRQTLSEDQGKGSLKAEVGQFYNHRVMRSDFQVIKAMLAASPV